MAAPAAPASAAALDPFVLYELRKPHQRGGAVVPKLRHNPAPSPANYRFIRTANDDPPRALDWDALSSSTHSTNRTSLLSEDSARLPRINEFGFPSHGSSLFVRSAQQDPVHAPVPLRGPFHLDSPPQSSAPAVTPAAFTHERSIVASLLTPSAPSSSASPSPAVPASAPPGSAATVGASDTAGASPGAEANTATRGRHEDHQPADSLHHQQHLLQQQRQLDSEPQPDLRQQEQRQQQQNQLRRQQDQQRERVIQQRQEHHRQLQQKLQQIDQLAPRDVHQPHEKPPSHSRRSQHSHHQSHARQRQAAATSPDAQPTPHDHQQPRASPPSQQPRGSPTPPHSKHPRYSPLPAAAATTTTPAPGATSASRPRRDGENHPESAVDGHSDWSDPHATNLDVYCEHECNCDFEELCVRHCRGTGASRSGGTPSLRSSCTSTAPGSFGADDPRKNLLAPALASALTPVPSHTLDSLSFGSQNPHGPVWHPPPESLNAVSLSAYAAVAGASTPLSGAGASTGIGTGSVSTTTGALGSTGLATSQHRALDIDPHPKQQRAGLNAKDSTIGSASTVNGQPSGRWGNARAPGGADVIENAGSRAGTQALRGAPSTRAAPEPGHGATSEEADLQRGFAASTPVVAIAGSPHCGQSASTTSGYGRKASGTFGAGDAGGTGGGGAGVGTNAHRAADGRNASGFGPWSRASPTKTGERQRVEAWQEHAAVSGTSTRSDGRPVGGTPLRSSGSPAKRDPSHAPSIDTETETDTGSFFTAEGTVLGHAFGDQPSISRTDKRYGPGRGRGLSEEIPMEEEHMGFQSSSLGRVARQGRQEAGMAGLRRPHPALERKAVARKPELQSWLPQESASQQASRGQTDFIADASLFTKPGMENGWTLRSDSKHEQTRNDISRAPGVSGEELVQPPLQRHVPRKQSLEPQDGLQRRGLPLQDTLQRRRRRQANDSAPQMARNRSMPAAHKSSVNRDRRVADDFAQPRRGGKPTIASRSFSGNASPTGGPGTGGTRDVGAAGAAHSYSPTSPSDSAAARPQRSCDRVHGAGAAPARSQKSRGQSSPGAAAPSDANGGRRRPGAFEAFGGQPNRRHKRSRDASTNPVVSVLRRIFGRGGR